MNNIIFFISNNLVLCVMWFCFLSIIIFLIFKQFYSKAKLINNFYAIKLINKKNANIIDTRSLEAYDKGHILNAIHIPLKNISLDKIQKLNLSTTVPIILIIDSAENNDKYIKQFINLGINNIYILKNGMNAWKMENLPIIINNK